LRKMPHARHSVTFRNIRLLPFLVHVDDLPRLPRTRILPLAGLSRVPVSNATRKIAASALSHILE